MLTLLRGNLIFKRKLLYLSVKWDSRPIEVEVKSIGDGHASVAFKKLLASCLSYPKFYRYYIAFEL